MAVKLDAREIVDLRPSKNSDARIGAFLTDGLARSRADEVRAKQISEQAQRATSVWTHLVDFQARDWPAHMASLFMKEAAYFQTLEASGDERWQKLAQLRQVVQDRAKVALKRFPLEFEQACEEARLNLDTTSRHPRYTIRNFIRIEVDEDHLQARVTPRNGERRDIPTDVPAIVQHLVDQNHRLFEREFRPTKFLHALLTAYQAALREDTREGELLFGEEIPLRRVTNRMSKNLSRFSADEFNVDLATAIRQNQLTVDGYRLHVSQTRNTRQGMLLYGMDESGYVGLIKFSKDKT
jgi:hypothetical protein